MNREPNHREFCSACGPKTKQTNITNINKGNILNISIPTNI